MVLTLLADVLHGEKVVSSLCVSLFDPDKGCSKCGGVRFEVGDEHPRAQQKIRIKEKIAQGEEF